MLLGWSDELSRPYPTSQLGGFLKKKISMYGFKIVHFIFIRAHTVHIRTVQSLWTHFPILGSQNDYLFMINICWWRNKTVADIRISWTTNPPPPPKLLVTHKASGVPSLRWLSSYSDSLVNLAQSFFIFMGLTNTDLNYNPFYKSTELVP